jgi:hypothetical protein
VKINIYEICVGRFSPIKVGETWIRAPEFGKDRFTCSIILYAFRNDDFGVVHRQSRCRLKFRGYAFAHPVSCALGQLDTSSACFRSVRNVFGTRSCTNCSVTRTIWSRRAVMSGRRSLPFRMWFHCPAGLQLLRPSTKTSVDGRWYGFRQRSRQEVQTLNLPPTHHRLAAVSNSQYAFEYDPRNKIVIGQNRYCGLREIPTSVFIIAIDVVRRNQLFYRTIRYTITSPQRFVYDLCTSDLEERALRTPEIIFPSRKSARQKIPSTYHQFKQILVLYVPLIATLPIRRFFDFPISFSKTNKTLGTKC